MEMSVMAVVREEMGRRAVLVVKPVVRGATADNRG